MSEYDVLLSDRSSEYVQLVGNGIVDGDKAVSCTVGAELRLVSRETAGLLAQIIFEHERVLAVGPALDEVFSSDLSVGGVAALISNQMVLTIERNA